MTARLLRTLLYAVGFAIALAGALNAAFGYASAEVTIGLAAALVLWLYVVPPVPRPPHPNRPRVVAAEDLEWYDDWESEFPDHPIARWQHRQPSHELRPRVLKRQHERPDQSSRLAQVALVVGVIAGTITIVNGVIDFISKVAGWL